MLFAFALPMIFPLHIDHPSLPRKSTISAPAPNVRTPL